ncbi:MAG: DUF2934 domain-containing protein [Gallionella sp.]
MAEKKVKPATKKLVPKKAGSAVKSKTPITKTAKKPGVKKPAIKKTAATMAKPKKTRVPAVKKAGTSIKKKTPHTQIPGSKAATSNATPATTQIAVKPTPSERYRMVETAAYFIAEQHGFHGRSDEHWATAEREIAAKLGQ